MFEQLLLALKNRVCPEFTVLNVFFILQNFEQLALALKNRVCPENFHSIQYSFYIQDFWATWACPEKQSVPWIHCIEYIFLSFRILNKPALALKNRICPEIFHCIEIFFIFQYFWATWSCPENRVCPEFFKLGVGRPPPPRTPLPATILLPERRSGPFRLTFTSALMRSLMTLYSVIDRELWTNFSSKATTAALAVSVILQFLFEKI